MVEGDLVDGILFNDVQGYRFFMLHRFPLHSDRLLHPRILHFYSFLSSAKLHLSYTVVVPEMASIGGIE